MIDINVILQSWLGIVFEYVASLGQYEIVENVSFLGVIIGIGIFGIIARIFYGKIVGGV